MPVFLFEIDADNGETFCFGLHVDDMEQANEMLRLMSSAVYVGELESPETLEHEVAKQKLH